MFVRHILSVNRPVVVSRVVSGNVYMRSFSMTYPAFAKKNKKEDKKGKKGKKEEADNEDAESAIDPSVLLKDLTKSYDNTLQAFQKQLNTLKMGRSNPKVFDNIQVKLEDYTATFTDIAMATNKTPTMFNVTVFDPAHTKRVVSAILAANLNLTPEVDPKNEQLLKIKIPSTSKEMKEKAVKDMKSLVDQYKSNAAQKDSLAAHRAKMMKEVKSLEGAKDIIKKLNQDVELLFKKYSDKLQDAFKTAEKQIK